MKAVKLFLKNVGPFCEETVDFSKLTGLFLITGETGSGKTFIFDAMTYALYDTTCGTRGILNNNMLISRNRKADEDSYVVFTFSVGGIYYRVTRYLDKVSRPTTLRAILEVSHDDGVTFELKSEKAEVKKDILEILKLTADEFSKIVLLPQGQFEEFLTSNSDKKKEILKKMFNVEKFSRIVEYIKVKEKKFSDDLLALEKINGQISHGKKLEELESDLELNRRSVSDLSANEKKVNENLTLFSVREKSLNEEKKASEKKSECERFLESEKNKIPEIENLERKLELAKKADSIAVVLKDFQRASLSLDDRKKELKDAERKFLDAEKNLSESLVSFNEIPVLENSVKSLSVEIAALDEKLGKAKDFEKINKKYEDVQKNRQILRIEHEKTEKTLSELKKSLPEDKNIDGYILSLLSEKNELEGCVRDAESKLEDCRKNEVFTAEIKSLEKKIKDCVLLKEQLESSLAEKEKGLETAKTQSKIADLMSQAAKLAAELEDGVPCPVCGSKSHPHPAEGELAFDYGKQIEDLEAEIKSLEKQNGDNEIELGSLRFKFEERKKAVESLGECVPSSEAEKNLADIREKLDSCLKKYSEAENLKKQIDRLEEEILATKNRLNETEKDLAQVETEWNIAKKDLGDDLSAADIEEKLSFSTSRHEELSMKIADTRKVHSACSNAVAECSAYLDSSRKGVAEAEDIFNLAEKAFAEKLSENPEFDGEKSVEDALIPLNIQKSIQSEISAHRESMVRLETQIAAFGEIRESTVVAHEMEIIAAEKDKLSAESEKLSEKLMELNGNCALLESAIEELKKNSKKITEIQNKHKCYQYLRQKFSYKTQLDTWALGAYYSRIVDFASQRFEKLSGGRYRLKQNMDFNSGRANSDTSLDLIVEDTYCGQYSGIASLSGGERFEASLSLALALTDSVRSRNGGVDLDSIFIDEGFGTLDSKTRNLIKPVLEDLQINQKKTVGIISHVEAFKEEITDQIQLDKSGQGTHVKIVKK